MTVSGGRGARGSEHVHPRPDDSRRYRASTGPNGEMTDSGDHEADARARMAVAGTARPLAVDDELAVPGDQESRDPARVAAAAWWP